MDLWPGIRLTGVVVPGIPPRVAAAYERAASCGFEMSCDVDVGRFLAVLAASLPAEAQVLELGSGVGVGVAWLLHGIGDRADVDVMTVEIDADTHDRLVAEPWPPWVTCRRGDAVDLLPLLGSFDLIFADAQGGKWDRLDLTIAALSAGGILIVDDMTPEEWISDEHRRNTELVARTLLQHHELVAAELAFGTGVIAATKRV